MTFPVVPEITDKFVGQPFDLNTAKSPDQIWAMLDGGPEQVRAGLNTLIAALNSTGSDNWLYTQIVNSLLGQVPDGSILDLKLSNTPGQIKEVVNTHLAKIKQDTIYAKAIAENLVIPTNSLITARKALQLGSNGIIKIAFVGTSITEGANQLLTDDCFPNRVMDRVTKTLPSTSITWQNFGLGGRNLANFIDSNYKATNPETNITLNYWRSWSVVGQSWADAVKAFAPDLLIVEFGMNDAFSGGNSDYTFYNNLVSLKTIINGWTKIPSIAMVPAHLPTTNAALYSQRQDVTQAIMRTMRKFANDNGYICADANRLFKILRDGIDDVSRQATTVTVATNYPVNWSGDTGSYSTNGNHDLITNGTQVGKYATYERIFYNGVITFYILNNVEGDNGAAYIKYRSNDIGCFNLVITAGASATVGLYYNSTFINAHSITLPFGTGATFQIVVKDNRHTVYMNGALVLDSYTPYDMRDGYVSFGSLYTIPNFGAPTIIYEDGIQNSPIYTESDLLGIAGGSQSGNGINHLTGLGYSICFDPVFSGMIEGMRIPYPRGVQIGVTISSGTLIPLANTALGETAFYTNFVVVKPYNPQLPMTLFNPANGEFYHYRPDLSGGSYTQLKHHEFTYNPVDATHDQVIMQTESAINFSLYQFHIF